MRADLGLGDCGDFVRHQATRHTQTVTRVWLYRQAEQRRLRLVGGEGTDRDGVRRVKAIVLHDDDGARLAGILLAASDGPDVAG